MNKIIINGLAIMLMTLILVFSCKKKETEPSEDTNNYGSGNGMVTFYLKSDLGLGSITVSVDGQAKGTITQFHSGGVTCGSGNVNVTLSKGNHTLYAVSQTGSVIWNNTFTIYEGDCLPFELTYSGSGGTTTGGTTTGGTTTGGGSGQLTIYNSWQTPCTSGAGNTISVYVNGSPVGGLNAFFSSPPSCGATGCITLTKSPGSYNVTASCGGNSWNKTVTVYAGQCTKLNLQQ